MKKFFKVVSEFFDDGKVNAFISTVEADERPRDVFESLSKCDRYTDYFDDPVRAEQWLQNTLSA